MVGPRFDRGRELLDTRDGSFADQVALELGEGGEDMENEPPGRRAGFNLLGQGFEVDLTLFELCDKADEVGQIAPKPVEPPDDEGVSLAEAFEASFKLRPADVLAACLFFVHLPAFGVLEGVPLQVERLVVGGDAGVADAHVSNLIKARVFRT